MFAMHADLGALHRIETDILAATKQALGQAAFLAARLARSTTSFHDHTGNLRRSIVRTDRADGHIIVRAGGQPAPYGKFVEDGTKAHEIRPKRTGGVSSRRAAGRSLTPLLRFQIGGRWVSARVVHHPGTKPAHFMLDARNQAETQLVRVLEAGLRRLSET